MITMMSSYKYVAIQSYCIVVGYTLHTAHFIPVTHLFCNWKFVPPNLPHLFLPSPMPLPSGNHLFVLCTYNCFCFAIFVYLVCFLDSSCK